MRRRFLPGLLLAAWAAAQLVRPAWAAEAAPPPDVGGIRYEAAETLAGTRLQLNGAGVRYKAIFKVYTAGLYLSRPATTPEAVYAMPGPRRLHIVMLRDIDANELGKLFTQGMEKNATREEWARSITGTLRLAELFSRMKHLASGDAFTLDYVPGQGTVVVVNGKAEIEPIREPEFFNALLAIWLGKSPADDRLKAALLNVPMTATGR
mgnify:CR=1 FL=1